MVYRAQAYLRKGSGQCQGLHAGTRIATERTRCDRRP